MTESERAVEELLLALGPIDLARARKAALTLQETRTIGIVQARQLTAALATLGEIVNALPQRR